MGFPLILFLPSLGGVGGCFSSLLPSLGGAGGGFCFTSVHYYAATFDGYTMLHGFDDTVGILVLHLDKGKALHKVYTTHLDLIALDIIIDKAHNLTRVHLINLTHIQEKAGITLLGGVVILTTRAFSSTLLGTRWGFNFRCIGIILQETAKLAAQDTLDKVVLIQPGPALLHLVHEGSYLLLIDLYALYIVDNMIELLATDLARLGQGTLLELLLDDLLHQADTTPLPEINDTEAGALLTGTTRTTAAMGIVLDIIRHAIVDDMRQVVHIQATGCHIRSHQQLGAVLAELLHGKVALLLGKVAMQGIGIVAIANQVVCHLLRLHTGTTEDNGIDARIEIHQTFQRQVLILGMHHIIDVIHVLSALVATAHLNLALLLQVVLGDTLDLLAHGSTEKQCAMTLGNTLEDGIQLFLETHGEHLVRLVQHHVLNLREVGSATLHQVDQSTRCGHDNIYPSLQGPDLRFYVSTSVYRKDGKIRQIFTKTLHIIGDLYTKFACRRKDNDRRGPLSTSPEGE